MHLVHSFDTLIEYLSFVFIIYHLFLLISYFI